MLKNNTKSYGELRQFVENLPVIDTHGHFAKYSPDRDGDALDKLMSGYYGADYTSAGGEESIPIEGLSQRERYDRFMRIYEKSNKTAYARGTLETIRLWWGVGRIESYEDFLAFDARIKERSPITFEQLLENSNIKAMVTNIYLIDEFDSYLSGKEAYFPNIRFAIPLPSIHNLHEVSDITRFQRYLKKPITCLDDYLACIDAHFKECVDFGVVCVKDQSAYLRSLAYGLPVKADAERVFNNIIFNPREKIGDDTGRVLDDYVFYYLMRKSAEYDLPVQVHTGHMAGNWNEIEKTNAVHFIPTLELHKDVRFDLFHANWPYMDEYLFIGKNYPNVCLNLCWTQVIDPLYCIELMKRAVMTVPQNKIFAFGSDVGLESVWGYLSMAKNNVACALSELTESGWLDIGEAKQIAKDWFFNNPNEFYKLGFQSI